MNCFLGEMVIELFLIEYCHKVVLSGFYYIVCFWIFSFYILYFTIPSFLCKFASVFYYNLWKISLI